MHTISSLRKSLGLATANQVRNRVEAVRDVLEPHLRRGPNNQILLTDEGLALLRQLQELYDSGLRMAEASDVIRASSVLERPSQHPVSPGFTTHRTLPTETSAAPLGALQDEISFLRSRVVELEARLCVSTSPIAGPSSTWWDALREDVDGA